MGGMKLSGMGGVTASTVSFAIYASAKRRQQCRYGRRYRCNAATGEKRMGGEGNDWSDEAAAETVGNFRRCRLEEGSALWS